MYKVTINQKSLDYLKAYFTLYREYYEDLYKDSWILTEAQIIDWYIKESINRKKEILELINNKISINNILWRRLEKSVILRWRTKYIFIEWEDDIKLKTRNIINIEIR